MARKLCVASGPPISSRVIHKGLIGPEGESGAMCVKPHRAIDPETEGAIFSEWLHDEITCHACLTTLGLPLQISRGRLLRDNLEARLEIAFQFVDANYWNREVRKPGEKKINPDPDGVLAAGFLKLNIEFEELIQPLSKMMEKHDGQFGWPDILLPQQN